MITEQEKIDEWIVDGKMQEVLFEDSWMPYGEAEEQMWMMDAELLSEIIQAMAPNWEWQDVCNWFEEVYE